MCFYSSLSMTKNNPLTFLSFYFQVRLGSRDQLKESMPDPQASTFKHKHCFCDLWFVCVCIFSLNGNFHHHWRKKMMTYLLQKNTVHQYLWAKLYLSLNIREVITVLNPFCLRQIFKLNKYLIIMQLCCTTNQGYVCLKHAKSPLAF